MTKNISAIILFLGIAFNAYAYEITLYPLKFEGIYGKNFGNKDFVKLLNEKGITAEYKYETAPSGRLISWYELKGEISTICGLDFTVSDVSEVKFHIPSGCFIIDGGINNEELIAFFHSLKQKYPSSSYGNFVFFSDGYVHLRLDKTPIATLVRMNIYGLKALQNKTKSWIDVLSGKKKASSWDDEEAEMIKNKDALIFLKTVQNIANRKKPATKKPATKKPATNVMGQ